MLRVVVCVSGGGTNLQAILDCAANGTLPGVEIVRVIANNPGVYALERAKAAGVEGLCISPKEFGTREEFNDALLAAVSEAQPDLIVLAGFLVAIPPRMVAAYPNRIINIHPSLIPSFCGKGYYGLKVHEAALARGVKVSGATVHFVDEGMDSGPIILQRAVAVQDGDTPQSLQRRIMEEAEWQILPEAIRLIAQGRVQVGTDRTTRITERQAQ
ncbi:MAG: phosphoribosylglycinamide formyltransferase [Eubacteriales bacterium]|nr:phosphoribosylglycinamide formyltransferase [Eubacteriales bacterium]